MSSINLIILGFLKKKPMSAYEITRHFEFKRMQKWVKVGSPTIFQNIKKLAVKNLLVGKTIKDTEMPEKVIYSLTEAGEEYFLELMDQFSAKPGKIVFDFNTFVANLGQVDKETALQMLNNLKMSFMASHIDVTNDYQELSDLPVEGVAIMKLYRTIFNDLIKWVDDLILHYETED